MMDIESAFRAIFKYVAINMVMGNYEIHPIGILLSLVISYIFGLLLLGYISGALFGVIGLSSYILTVRSLDIGPESS